MVISSCNWSRLRSHSRWASESDGCRPPLLLLLLTSPPWPSTESDSDSISSVDSDGNESTSPPLSSSLALRETWTGWSSTDEELVEEELAEGVIMNDDEESVECAELDGAELDGGVGRGEAEEVDDILAWEPGMDYAL